MQDENAQFFQKAINETDARMFDLTQEVTVIKLEQAGFRVLLKENTDATKKIESDLAEMLEFFTSVRGAFKVLNWIGALAKPIGAIAVAVAATWALFKGTPLK